MEKTFAVTYDQSSGLQMLIECAMGQDNLGNVSQDITQERFPLRGSGIQRVNMQVRLCLSGETSERAAKRLTAARFTLADTGDLAGFLHDHMDEVEKWLWVLAISESSRWVRPDGRVQIPCASSYKYGAGANHRLFSLLDFRRQLGSRYGILVLCKPDGT